MRNNCMFFSGVLTSKSHNHLITKMDKNGGCFTHHGSCNTEVSLPESGLDDFLAAMGVQGVTDITGQSPSMKAGTSMASSNHSTGGCFFGHRFWMVLGEIKSRSNSKT